VEHWMGNYGNYGVVSEDEVWGIWVVANRFSDGLKVNH